MTYLTIALPEAVKDYIVRVASPFWRIDRFPVVHIVLLTSF
jgi:hypothetical protein